MGRIPASLVVYIPMVESTGLITQDLPRSSTGLRCWQRPVIPTLECGGLGQGIQLTVKISNRKRDIRFRGIFGFRELSALGDSEIVVC